MQLLYTVVLLKGQLISKGLFDVLTIKYLKLEQLATTIHSGAYIGADSFFINFQKEKANTFTIYIILIVKSLQKS